MIDPVEFLLTPYEAADVAAVQAIANGMASSEQQKRALQWIVEKACRTEDDPFVPGEPELSANLSGRRSAGLAIRKLVNLSMTVVKDTTPRRPRRS